MDGFEQFAEAQATRLSRLAYRLVGHREAACDLVQDVLLDALRHWPKVSAASNRDAYVRRMLINRHLNGQRSRVVEVSRSEPPDGGSRDQPLGDAVEDRDAMWRALADLSDRQRTVLVLRFYEGLDDPAIAALVGCRRATVRGLAARGLATLRSSPHLQQPATDVHPRST